MRLAVAILLLNISPLTLLSHAYGQPHESQRETEQKQTQTAGDEPRSANAVDGHQEQRHNSDGDKAKENPYVPWYKKPEWIAVILTGIYVGITGWYVVVSHRTMNQIVRQADIADRAASAAQKSAEALAACERAWVIVELNILPVTGQGDIPIRMTYTNCGRSPAWVIGTWFHFDFYKAIPCVPDFSQVGKSLQAPHPLAPGGSAEVENISANVSRRPPETIVVMCGILKYRDVFGLGRETRFGYTVAPIGRTERIPSEDYNGYT